MYLQEPMAQTQQPRAVYERLSVKIEYRVSYGENWIGSKFRRLTVKVKY